MSLQRHFLDWNEPATVKVRKFLLPEQLIGPVDLYQKLIVVPTHQAGRRLREALASHCASYNTALLSPNVIIPTDLLRHEEDMRSIASPTEVMAVWANTLMKANLSDYRGLFPAQAPEQDFPWAIHMGKMIQQLRDSLADGGWQITSAYQEFKDIFEEAERWKDLAKLENEYLHQLELSELHDPIRHIIRQSESPELPEGIEQLIIAAVSEPTPLVVRALEHLSEQLPVTILVYAPESLAGHFDAWGRPIAEEWQSSQIKVPNDAVNIVLTSSPENQSNTVLDLIAEESNKFGPNDIAIGTPDSGIIPFLAAGLAKKDLPTFDPAGKFIKEHTIYHLLKTFHALVNENSYAAFSGFLRNADILTLLEKKHGISPRWLLGDLDKFQNQHLPLEWEHIANCFPGDGEARKFENLEKTVDFIRGLLESFEHKDFDSAIQFLLQTVYEVKQLNPQKPDDKEFIAVAKTIDSTLREMGGNTIAISKEQRLSLFLERLGEQRYFLDREGTVIDLDGWLELLWNDAPFLIVTGMNEGKVPNSKITDIFLSDSMRRQMQLRHDGDRLATDAYIMHALIAPRDTSGRVCFIAGKTSNTGDPLKPSRLLFLCSDEDLPHRAGKLFGNPEDKGENYPATISFRLETQPPSDVPANRLAITKMPVTWFKDYLSCPFRFYLKRVLEMDELDDQKTEMDSLDFGVMVHHALQTMSAQNMRDSEKNEDALIRFLQNSAQSWVTERFGQHPPLQVEIQLHSAKQRLAAAARTQTKLAREGWDILRHEMNAKIEIGGMHITGRIDRIDRHRENGTIRILDYKTSDKVTKPEDAHFGSVSLTTHDFAKVQIGSKEKRWIDLQLPLYHMMLPESKEFAGPIEIGYFNLPKAVSETGVYLWSNFNNDLLESAQACAQSIVRGIQNHAYWPPADKITYDDFSKLFHAEITDCINIG